jgi:hypothetical protein
MYEEGIVLLRALLDLEHVGAKDTNELNEVALVEGGSVENPVELDPTELRELRRSVAP